MAVFSLTFPKTYHWAIEINEKKIKNLEKLITKAFGSLSNPDQKFIKKFIIFLKNGQKIEVDNADLISEYIMLEKEITKISIVFRQEANAVKISLARRGFDKGPNVLYYVRGYDEEWFNNTIIKIRMFLETLKLSYSFLFKKGFINFRKVLYPISIIILTVLIGIFVKRTVTRSLNLSDSIPMIILNLILIIITAVFLWGITHLFRYLFPKTVLKFSEDQIQKNQKRERARRLIFESLIVAFIVSSLAGLTIKLFF